MDEKTPTTFMKSIDWLYKYLFTVLQTCGLRTTRSSRLGGADPYRTAPRPWSTVATGSGVPEGF